MPDFFAYLICIALEDVNGDGDHLLLVGDLGSGQFDMKLKMYKGELPIFPGLCITVNVSTPMALLASPKWPPGQ